MKRRGKPGNPQSGGANRHRQRQAADPGGRAG